MDDFGDKIGFFDNPHPNPAKAIYALHCLQNPDALKAARARFDKSPSPSAYPSPSSDSDSSRRTVFGPEYFNYRESTADAEKREAREAKHRLFRSTPHDQFRLQVDLELARIQEQSSDTPLNKAYFLPYDKDKEGFDNAIDNIRAEWIKRGIWAKEWFPTRHQPEGIMFGTLWGHERPASLPRPKPAPELGKGKGKGKGKTKGKGKGRTQPQPSLPPPPPSEPKLIEASHPVPKPPDNVYIPAYRKLTVRNMDASRPVKQFHAQVRRETAWLKFTNDNSFRWKLHWHKFEDDDSPKPKRPKISSHDLKQSATQAVIDRWKKWGIWNPAWTDEQLPGEAWAHEGYIAEMLPIVIAAEAAAPEETSDAKSTTGQKRGRDHEANEEELAQPATKKLLSFKATEDDEVANARPLRRSARIAAMWRPEPNYSTSSFWD